MGKELARIVDGEAVHFDVVEEVADDAVTERLFVVGSLMRAQRGEARPLQHIEDGLNSRIIGQSRAIESIITALNRDGIRDPKRPLASLLLQGPTGVGKSETPKVLDELLHGADEDTLTQINCSEIGENHRVSALLGAAPEFVGREQKPLLDKKKIERERSIVLFDEIEKGAPALDDLLLQILEDGEVTLLGTGEKISFKNSIIILTSNLGAKEMRNKSTGGLGFRNHETPHASQKEIEDAAKNALKLSRLKPELLNRIDDKIVYRQLTDPEIGQVLDRHVEKSNVYYRKKGINLILTPEVRDELVRTCVERHEYNARPVLRRYEQWVEGLLGDYVNTGGIPAGSRVFTFLDDEMPEDAPLNERIALQYMRDESLIIKPQRALPAGKSAASRQEQLADIEPLFRNNRRAIGTAAAIGLAAMFAADYITSKRRYA